MGRVNSARLKSLRKERKLIQDDIAKIIGIGRTGYVRIENGERDADTETLAKLADLFNVSVDYLLGRTDKREGIVIGKYTFTPIEIEDPKIKELAELFDKLTPEQQEAILNVTKNMIGNKQ